MWGEERGESDLSGKSEGGEKNGAVICSEPFGEAEIFSEEG